MMKLTFVLVLVLAGAASGAIEKRVVGSKDCKKDRQYHVQIESVTGGKSCGGSLLNTRWVITAAHCGGQLVNLKLGLNNDVSFIKKFGSWLKGSSKKYVQQIKTDQQFTYTDEENSHDIMLIKLNEDMSAGLPTISLPSTDCTQPEVGQEVEIGGWGSKKADIKKAKTPSKLRCASTTMRACGENDKPSSNYFSDESNTMCASKPGVEVCYGDAGSAVEYNNAIYGIVVNNPVDKCEDPIVMLNLCFYMNWIDETMQKNK